MTTSDDVLTLKNGPAAEQRRAALEAIYGEIPCTSCECDRLGQCCELTEEEMRSDFATMYPLYAVEYLNIVEYVETHFSPEEGERVLGLTEERPTRCPFLTASGRCSIHPARPLTCRTYGVLRGENLIEAAGRNAGLIPVRWINGFLTIESNTICAKSRVLDPEQVARHADRMVQGHYDRALAELSEPAPLLDDRRRGLLKALTGQDRISRWTWGGFNALARSSQEWFREKFADYWRRAELAG